MGYSAKYHAMSLMAVFVALAIGILIGAGFGESLIEGSADQLSASLSEDLDEAQAELDATREELDSERDYSMATFPALVENRLRDQQLMVVALGPRPGEVRNDITGALEPSGAVVHEVVAFPDEIDRDEIAEAIGVDPASIAASDTAYAAMVRRLARSMVKGNEPYRGARDRLGVEFSGAVGPSDGVIVVREPRSDDATPLDKDAQIFQAALLDGLVEAGIPVVGVRRSDGDPDATLLFLDNEISSVDNVDEVSGRVALVFALRDRHGSFGTGDTATALIPDLLGVPPLEPIEDLDGEGEGNGGGDAGNSSGNGNGDDDS